MKIAASFILLSEVLVPGLFGQTQTNSSTRKPYEIRISPEVAEKLILQKVELVCPRVAMPARVTGTVVVAIEIGKTGDVVYSKVISGPAMLKKPVLDAVRMYKYKPYLLNGKPVAVETSVSVAMDSYQDCYCR